MVLLRFKAPSFECTDTLGCVTIAPGEPVKIAALLALSGGAAPFGTEQLHSIELALDQQQHQLLGHPMRRRVQAQLHEHQQALQHAFPDGRQGEIRIRSHTLANGVGLPEMFDPAAPTSLGLRLVEMITHKRKMPREVRDNS